MDQRLSGSQRTCLGAMLGAIVGCMAITFGMDAIVALRGDRVQPYPAELVLFFIPFIATIIVGTALILRRPQHRVGWLFLALGLALALTGPFDTYTFYGAREKTLDLPGDGFAAVLSDISFMPLLGIIALILLNTPSGRVDGRRWQAVGWVAVLSVAIAMLAAMTGPYRGNLQEFGVENPLELTAALVPVRSGAIAVLHIAVVASLASVVLRFRRSAGPARAQLRWVALAGLPFVVLLFATYFAAVTGENGVLLLLGGGFLSCFPIAAWVAIERDQLYDVDRLLSRGLTYVLLTGIVVVAYTSTVVLLGQSLGSRVGESQTAAVLGTLFAVSLALPLRNRIQRSLDRRFNRRAYDAVERIRRFVHEAEHAATIETALREATSDHCLAVLFWIEERGQWVTEDGTTGEPAPGSFSVDRHGAPLAAISYAPETVNPRVLAEAVTEALPELEAARLRAAIALQLVEVRESRARIVAAQLAERHRLERNLHDGAQQRLLALAMQLRAVEVSGDADRAKAILEPAIEQTREAVRELRELANGLRPELLRDGGLPAAFEDLARRTPVPLRHQVSGERPTPEVEETAWFIVCEAVANAVKHARPGSIAITAAQSEGALHIAVADDGPGGADVSGRGLRGIIDRAEAAGGWLRIDSGPAGTTIAAELPCAS